MVKKEIQRLMSLFPSSFINSNFELILEPKTNLYFLLSNVKTVEDLQFKIIAWCSRAASKTQPYHVDWRNEEYRAMVRDSINEFLGTDFVEHAWLKIYDKFGNGLREEQCRKFIQSGFDFNLVNGEVDK